MVDPIKIIIKKKAHVQMTQVPQLSFRDIQSFKEMVLFQPWGDLKDLTNSADDNMFNISKSILWVR